VFRISYARTENDNSLSLQLTHALLDSICSGKTLRYEIFGKLWTIEEWKLFHEAGKEELMQFIAKGLSKEQV